MTWLLDANLLIRAEDAGRLQDLLATTARVPCAVAREVHDELCGRGGRKRDARHAHIEGMLAISKLEVIEVELGSPTAVIYEAVRSGRTTAGDAGECQSIAIAHGREDVWFVTGEPRAGWLALLELGGRVRALPSFLRHALEADVLARDVAEEILAAAESRSGLRRPTWWR